MRACIAFAWKNLVRGDRLRLAIALAGATVAVFLLLLHLAFLRAVAHKATQVYALFDAELVMVSQRFQFLYRMGDFPAARLRQALAVSAVADTAAVRIGSSHWGAPQSREASSLLLIGLDPEPAFIADPALRALLTELRAPRSALLDRRSEPQAGALHVGAQAQIGARPTTIVGLYELGLPMYAGTTAIVANSDFSFYTGQDAQRVQLGLLRLAPGADAAQAASALATVLPDDVRVLTRADLMARERDYFIEVKPLGILMRAGLAIGVLVGAVALFQVLSTQMEARRRDFAVLRAMGFGAAFTYAVGAWQLTGIGAAAFAGAWLAAWPVFDVIAARTHLALPLDAALAGGAAALCAPMIAVAAAPLWRAGRADPAALFTGAS